MLYFEWDPTKATSNLHKHSVSFKEASSIFADSLSYTFNDPANSYDETRLLTIGLASTRKLLIVSHTECQGKIRIISARKLTKKEREFYERGY
ncbi:MAG: BrnT family toxin [Deinococcota bacterium]